MIQNRHKGERFIIGGCSPHALTLPSEFLATGRVIGINAWFKRFPLDYFIGLDTGVLYRLHGPDIVALKVPKFIRTPNPQTESFVPYEFADHWIAVENNFEPPSDWDEAAPCLKYVVTTAISAIHLAKVMGAGEIILWGVDIKGSGQFMEPGGFYNDGFCWDRHVDGINKALALFGDDVPIYKTNPESLLNLPLYDFGG
jgi:hypothetical protein